MKKILIEDTEHKFIYSQSVIITVTRQHQVSKLITI